MIDITAALDLFSFATTGKMVNITKADLSKHNSPTDCWIAVSGKVYNVTDFLGDHPGGKKAILLYAGKDASEEFLMLHKPDIIVKYGAPYLVGDLV